MKKYVPIVTDDPQDNVEAALNLVFIKDEEVYVRGYGPAPDFSDATLSNVTRDILQKYSPETLENVRLKDDLELSCATSEWLFDGIRLRAWLPCSTRWRGPSQRPESACGCTRRRGSLRWI